MNIRIETETFEGPLDLLVYLIKKREVSIYDIPIAEITEEFLDYIYTMQELNIPLASEFLLMAATLARIKSEYLIPREESEDPRKELVQIIEEYLKSKKAAKELEKLEEEALKCYPHDPSELIFQFQEKIKIANTVTDLQKAFQNILLLLQVLDMFSPFQLHLQELPYDIYLVYSINQQLPQIDNYTYPYHLYYISSLY